MGFHWSWGAIPFALVVGFILAAIQTHYQKKRKGGD